MVFNDFIEKHIDLALEYRRATFQGFLERALPVREFDSPLEAVFWVWWQALDIEESYPWIHLAWQHEVILKNEKFRIDFVVQERSVERINGNTYRSDGVVVLAVELDGHEFHERTKEQVERRNYRDRQLIAAGWTVLHFSGSEINRDPARCVREVGSTASRLAVEYQRSRLQAEREQ